MKTNPPIPFRVLQAAFEEQTMQKCQNSPSHQGKRCVAMCVDEGLSFSKEDFTGMVKAVCDRVGESAPEKSFR